MPFASLFSYSFVHCTLFGHFADEPLSSQREGGNLGRGRRPSVPQPPMAAKDVGMTERNPNDVVRLTTTRTPAQAHIIEQALRDEGIECRVVGDYLDAGIGDISGIMAEVWVHEQDKERAEEILRRSTLS